MLLPPRPEPKSFTRVKGLEPGEARRMTIELGFRELNPARQRLCARGGERRAHHSVRRRRQPGQFKGGATLQFRTVTETQGVGAPAPASTPRPQPRPPRLSPPLPPRPPPPPSPSNLSSSPGIHKPMAMCTAVGLAARCSASKSPQNKAGRWPPITLPPAAAKKHQHLRRRARVGNPARRVYYLSFIFIESGEGKEVVRAGGQL